ncbi:alpha/beta hydrolase family protein [Xanthomonas campestris]|uniref:alpha/beta hydrolase family protein n=1 Tax=Xanthomonas campestris TaxID=339 RepID=UPI001E2E6D72|nr:alpha/beta fold hydrolase [Xanthomonas campestris]MCC5085811.1 alpha/beta fold hydrolase [Xanthomonas campestris]
MGLINAAYAATAADGHGWQLLHYAPAQPIASLLWLPALGVAARHYAPFAQALAERGIAVFVHEWRGNGSSTLRASRRHDWGFRTLLEHDLPASQAIVAAQLPPLPRLLGGHSLGGQLACCHAALHPGSAARLWLVASGSPYWRNFPPPLRYGLPLAYRFLPWLARVQGVLHGRRLGFAGTEARSLIADWARVGRSNRYRAAGAPWDLEQALASVICPIDGVVFAHDRFGPATALHALCAKMPQAPATLHLLDDAALGVRSDHFAWMRAPIAVAAALRTSLHDR